MHNGRWRIWSSFPKNSWKANPDNSDNSPHLVGNSTGMFSGWNLDSGAAPVLGKPNCAQRLIVSKHKCRRNLTCCTRIQHWKLWLQPRIGRWDRIQGAKGNEGSWDSKRALIMADSVPCYWILSAVLHKISSCWPSNYFCAVPDAI